MERLDFTIFSAAVDNKFQKLASNPGYVLTRAGISGDDLFNVYLEAFPKEVNTVFRERRHYDGSYDKHFIRRLGNIVAVDKQGNKYSIWDVELPGYFQIVADAVHAAVISAPLESVFISAGSVAGSKNNKDSELDIIWNHFHSVIPPKYVIPKARIGEVTGSSLANIEVLRRSLTELTLDALETVQELITSNSLYRGTEHKLSVDTFIKHKKAYDKVPDDKKEAFLFHTALSFGPSVRFRNTVIGTLVTDISLAEKRLIERQNVLGK